MKYVRVLFVLYLFESLSVFGETVSEDCEKEWPGDYQMQEYCIEQAADGAEIIKTFMARYGITDDNYSEKSVRGEVPALILSTCSEEWHPDLKMIAHCLQEQEKAAIRLGKIGGAPEKSIEFKPGVMGDIAAIAVASDYLKQHNFENVAAAEEAAARGEQAGVIFVECRSDDHRDQAKCLLTRGGSE